MSALLAFTVEHAARVTKVSERRIRYWDKTGVLSPSLARDTKRRLPYSRIYSFRDLVGLRTLGELRDQHHFSLQELRSVGEWLNDHYEQPWSTLRFYVLGHQIIFRDPDSEQFVASDPRGQAAIPFYLERIAVQTEAEARKLLDRGPEQIGEVVRNRYVLSNTPVLAGTRIPTSAVWDFYQAGYEPEAIIREYPRLTPLDIDRAIAFEQELREQRAS
jgi:uncharacterized protein (DUF433 family)